MRKTTTTCKRTFPARLIMCLPQTYYYLVSHRGRPRLTSVTCPCPRLGKSSGGMEPKLSRPSSVTTEPLKELRRQKLML